jgi:hypothetical protein
MANILGLALKVTGDASSLAKSLSPVDKALASIGKQAEKATSVFAPFTAASAAAANAQQGFADRFAALAEQFRNTKDANAYAESFARLTKEAKDVATAFGEGIRVTEANRTAEQKRAIELENLSRLLKLNAIDQDTYNRATAEASGANAAALEAERGRAAILAEGERVTQQYATAEEKRALELEKINRLVAEGAISQETYNRAFAASSEANIEFTRAVEEAAAAQEKRAAEDRQAQAQSDVITAKYQTDAEKRATILADLDDRLAKATISEETHSRAVADVTGANAAAAAAEAARQRVVDEGLRITERYATAEEQRAAEMARLTTLLDQGAISEETFSRATAEASGANAAAAKAERERADALAAASRIIQANLGPQERYDQQMQELRKHLDGGRLSQEQFNKAAARARKDLDEVGKSAAGADKNIDRLNRNVGILATIEVGRVLVSGFQLIGNAFTSATNQVTSLVTNVNTSLDTLNDFSARTGVGVEALQGYSLAAKLAGVDTEQFGSAIQKLAVNIGKATPGDALDKSLRGINLSVAELRSLAPEEQFGAISNAISQLPTAADRAAAAVSLFGKQGAALAPLFREGATSIDELTARAERLGAIVPESLIANIAEMNDRFDLVSATVQGIVGRVIGQLAPAVAAVADEFLKFIEDFNGGEGGQGIANTIADVLLNGAEMFAGVFDKVFADFDGFTSILSDAGDVFRFVGNILVGVSEGLRYVFNIFEVVGNNLLIGLGKVLEGLGSWVDSDLQQAGKDLANAGNEALERNKAELEAAKKNATEAVAAAFGGASNAAAEAGNGAGSQFVQTLRERIERERSPQFQIETNIEKTREQFDNFFGGVVDQGSAVTEAMRGFEAATASVIDPLNMTAQEIARIKEAQETVNRLIQQETTERTAANEAAAKQADQDTARIDGLLKTSDAASKVADDLAAVERERARIAEQGGADAQARLEQLDTLRANLEEQQQALEQGFGQGFEQAFEGADKAVADATDKAAEFGQAGADAAKQLQDGIESAKALVRDGFLGKEAYDIEVARQTDFFAKRIEQEKIAAAERKKADEDAAKARLQQEELVNGLIALQQVGGDQERIKAAENLVAINAEIARAEEAAAAARAAGDDEAQRAALTRLQQLDQVQAKEQDIASGAAKQREEFQKAFEKQQEEAAKAQEAQQQAVAQEQARIAEERRKAEEAEFARQQERVRQLNTLGSATVKTTDVRTAEGAALVLDLAASAQDPELIEARIQTKLLNQIALGLAGAASNYFNQPVAIVGAARLGGFG